MNKKLLAGLGVLSVAVINASAQSSVTSIVTAATDTFAAVATLCVAIGTFFIGYRLVKKAR